eukprot:3978232-Pleurochrysis_carterae.AAC.1
MPASPGSCPLPRARTHLVVREKGGVAGAQLPRAGWRVHRASQVGLLHQLVLADRVCARRHNHHHQGGRDGAGAEQQRS